MCILSLFAISLATVVTAQAQTTNYDNLKVKGKIIDGNTTYISVFQEDDGDWYKVKFKRTRGNYNLRLDPKKTHYITFETSDGLIKSMYVDEGSGGQWLMELDINFKNMDAKYARLYQHKNNKKYVVNVMDTDEKRIIVGIEDTYPITASTLE